ncbi:MAG: hypothetical protein DRJ65_04250 [Acidobacteria bacterium]|nr:MAG: hypothetical protein DRJ65_04250 [Acidobacteriota bacterium]
MARRSALLFLGLASPAMLICSWSSGFIAELCFILLVMAFPAALITLAVARHGLGPLKVPLAGLIIILEVGGVTMLVLRGQVLEGPWFGAFPVAASIQIYGLWLGPLLLVALAYGLTFDRWELPEEDLRRFNARRSGSDGDNKE